MEFLKTALSKQHGIYRAASTDHYWGVLPRDMMVRLNALCERKGVSAALKEFDFGDKRFDYASEPGRADFLYVLPLTQESVVLDLGSGYGNIALQLAQHAGHVVAADATYELLRFSKMRADENAVTNLDFVHIDPLEIDTLPFAEKTFDVIILNGVLEWVGSGVATGDPEAHQRSLLRRLYTLLKDDGVICIAIENRLHPQWWKRDPHAKVAFTAIVPRALAQIIARAKGIRDGYRTYIYGRGGYRRLLRSAGFLTSKFYYPFSTYRSPKFIYGDDASESFLRRSGLVARIFTKKWRLFLRMAAWIGLEHTFLSSFIIVAGKTLPVPLEYGRRYFDTADSRLIMVKEKEGERRFLRMYDPVTARRVAEHELK